MSRTRDRMAGGDMVSKENRGHANGDANLQDPKWDVYISRTVASVQPICTEVS